AVLASFSLLQRAWRPQEARNNLSKGTRAFGEHLVKGL
ncbi:hypothetical protein LEMLEM_LOCUS1896, partial [Lemmus lemmus]